MRDFLKRYARNKGAVVGAVILFGIILMAILAPVLYPGDPWRMAGPPFQPPFARPGFPFGTDTLGRDVAAGVVHGARVSLTVGLVSTAISLTIGTVIGAVAGYFGGRVDYLAMRFTEFFQTLPTLVLVIVLVAVLQPSVFSIVAAIGIVSWPPVARLVRGQFLALRSREFVLAALLTGQGHARVIIKHILPNVMSPIVVTTTLMVATAILTESSLSFLGLGDRRYVSWGFLVGAARTVIRQAWWMSFFPGAAILLTVLALNLVGEGLSDALNPRLVRVARGGPGRRRNRSRPGGVGNRAA